MWMDLLKFRAQKQHITHQGRACTSTPRGALPQEQMKVHGRAGRGELRKDLGRLHGLGLRPVFSVHRQYLAGAQ